MSESISAISKQLFLAIFAKVGAFFKTIGQDFIKFVKTNPLYLLASILYCVIASFALGGLVNSVILACFSYIISLFIVFTPLGEKLLRFFEHVRKIETKYKCQW